MRIAVCAPQVPFTHGGAEIFADTLVEQLRARGHEADLVTVPFKWYPGARVLSQAFLWRLLDLEEADGRPIDAVDRDQVPLVRRPPPAQGRLAAAPVPAGVRPRRDGVRPVRRRRRGPRHAARRAPDGPGRARRGAAALRDLAERRRPAPRRHRARRGGAAASSAAAAVPGGRRRRRLRPLRRAGSTGRSASTCCWRRRRSTPELRCVVVGEGPDRPRLEELAR